MTLYPDHSTAAGVRRMNPQSLLETTSESRFYSPTPLHLPLSSVVPCRLRMQRWRLPSRPPSSPSLCATERLGLTEMEGLLFDSAPTGLLIVSKWSPPATALIICDPGCMLEEHVRDWDQQPCSSVV